MENFGEKYIQLKLKKIENLEYTYTINKSNFFSYSLNMTIFVLSIYTTFNIASIILKVMQ